MGRKPNPGNTRKTHKSLKTEPSPVPASSPSSTALATVDQPALSPISVPEIVKGPDDKKGPTIDTGIIEEVPKKQWWFRTPASKTRKLAEKIVVLRAAGHKDAAIAKKLKTTEGTVQQAIYVARKNKWLVRDESGEEEMVDLEVELAMNVERKIVRNISASLDGQMTNWQTHEMTIAAAKGRGIFKGENKQVEGPMGMPIVAIQVVMPPVGAGDQLPHINEDQMGGMPAFIEAETEDEP